MLIVLSTHSVGPESLPKYETYDFHAYLDCNISLCIQTRNMEIWLYVDFDRVSFNSTHKVQKSFACVCLHVSTGIILDLKPGFQPYWVGRLPFSSVGGTSMNFKDAKGPHSWRHKCKRIPLWFRVFAHFSYYLSTLHDVLCVKWLLNGYRASVEVIRSRCISTKNNTFIDINYSIKSDSWKGSCIIDIPNIFLKSKSIGLPLHL